MSQQAIFETKSKGEQIWKAKIKNNFIKKLKSVEKVKEKCYNIDVIKVA